MMQRTGSEPGMRRVSIVGVFVTVMVAALFGGGGTVLLLTPRIPDPSGWSPAAPAAAQSEPPPATAQPAPSPAPRLAMGAPRPAPPAPGVPRPAGAAAEPLAPARMPRTAGPPDAPAALALIAIVALVVAGGGAFSYAQVAGFSDALVAQLRGLRGEGERRRAAARAPAQRSEVESSLNTCRSSTGVASVVASTITTVTANISSPTSPEPIPIEATIGPTSSREIIPTPS